MSNKAYDICKYIAQVFLPALTVFVGVILKCFDVECTDIVITIMTAFDAFLGALLHNSSKVYNAPSDIGFDEEDMEIEEEK